MPGNCDHAKDHVLRNHQEDNCIMKSHETFHFSIEHLSIMYLHQKSRHANYKLVVTNYGSYIQ